MTYQKIQESFIKDYKNHMDMEYVRNEEKMQYIFRKACKSISEYQKNELVLPVQYMCITFLNTYYYMEDPVLRIYFYMPGMLWKKPVMHQDFSAEWITGRISEYEKQLKKYADEQKKTNEWLEIEKRKMVRLIVKLAAYYVKYFIMDCRRCDELQGVFKSSEFMVSFGEYMDWQLVLCMKREETDIFQRQQDESLRFREFSNMVYKNRDFKGLDMTAAYFKDCKFKGCKMKDNIFNDVVFDGCIFEDTQVHDGEMYGALFEDCTFCRSKFKDVKSEYREPSVDTVKGFFREVQYINCREV